MFDWKSFLTQNRIEYVTEGPNVASGNINIRCPFCIEDPSHHMGISLENGFWCCWRNQREHGGRAPHRLIAALLGVSYERANTIVGATGPVGELDDAVRRLGGDSIVKRHKLPKPLKMPGEFVTVKDKGPWSRFYNYLHKKRGFREQDVDRLVRQYDLRCCISGSYSYRLIVPVYMEPGKLMGWTGRTILPDESLRYKSLSHKKQTSYPLAPMNIKDTLGFYDQISRDEGDALIVVEGPFDALKVDFYARKYGVRATCVWSVNLQDAQIELLADLRSRYRQLIFVFDREALADSLRATSYLPYLEPIVWPFEYGRKDPGDLARREVRTLVKEILHV